jgi:hypothetical protein
MDNMLWKDIYNERPLQFYEKYKLSIEAIAASYFLCSKRDTKYVNFSSS